MSMEETLQAMLSSQLTAGVWPIVPAQGVDYPHVTYQGVYSATNNVLTGAPPILCSRKRRHRIITSRGIGNYTPPWPAPTNKQATSTKLLLPHSWNARVNSPLSAAGI